MMRRKCANRIKGRKLEKDEKKYVSKRKLLQIGGKDVDNVF